MLHCHCKPPAGWPGCKSPRGGAVSGGGHVGAGTAPVEPPGWRASRITAPVGRAPSPSAAHLTRPHPSSSQQPAGAQNQPSPLGCSADDALRGPGAASSACRHAGQRGDGCGGGFGQAAGEARRTCTLRLPARRCAGRAGRTEASRRRRAAWQRSARLGLEAARASARQPPAAAAAAQPPLRPPRAPVQRCPPWAATVAASPVCSRRAT